MSVEIVSSKEVVVDEIVFWPLVEMGTIESDNTVDVDATSSEPRGEEATIESYKEVVVDETDSGSMVVKEMTTSRSVVDADEIA